MKRTKIARRAVRAIIAALAVALLVAGFNWDITSSVVQRYDSLFKLVGLGIGPVLALLGFLWGLLDKAEMKDLAEELGDAKAQAAVESTNAKNAVSLLASKEARIAKLERDLQVVADASRVWKLRPNAPFVEYRGWKHDPKGAKIVTVGLFKGGVGKTHLASNFAAYVSEKKQKPVLLIDLDYQGSLSTTMLLAAGLEDAGSKVDALFAPNANIATLVQQRIHLARQPSGTVLNDGKGLSRAWLVPSGYTLAQLESRLLIERIFEESNTLDERYRLAHILLNPDVRREYALIILDTPPRMTLGTVNALVASHHFILPAIFDRVSSEAVGPFLAQLNELTSDLELDLRPAGIVGSLTRHAKLTQPEPRYRDQIADVANDKLGLSNHVLQANLPVKVQVRSELDLGYFLSDNAGPLSRYYDAVFDELWTRIMRADESP